MAKERVVIVDTGTISNLFRAGGAAAWDTLLDNGVATQRIVVCEDVLQELIPAPGGIRAAFDTWIAQKNTATIKVIVPDYRFVPLPDTNPDRGDASIRELIKGTLPDAQAGLAPFIAPGSDGFAFRLLTDDGVFFRQLKNEISTDVALKDGQFTTAYHGTFEYLSERLANKDISLATYKTWRDSFIASGQLNSLDTVDGSNFRGQVLDDAKLAEFNAQFPENMGLTGNIVLKGGVIGLAVGIANATGLIGDVLSFGITAAEAATLYESGDISGANELWTKYLFETAGGVGGAILGGIIGLRAGPWGSFAFALAGSVGGSLLGAAAGEALYRANPEVFDAIFEPMNSLINQALTTGDSFAEAFTKASMSALGFDMTAVQGGTGQDFLVASSYGERYGNGGDDFLLGWFPDAVLAGEKFDPTDPASGTATVNHVLKLHGGSGDDWLMSIGGEGSYQYGGDGKDWLVAVGGTTHMWGGDGITEDDHDRDAFSVFNGAFVHDAQADDAVFLGPLRLSGGVQLGWDEGGFAYWQPFSSIAMMLGPASLVGGGLLNVPLILLDLLAAQVVRYFQTDSGQLGIQFLRGDPDFGGQAMIENYALDVETGKATGGIVVFGADLVKAGDNALANYRQYFNLAFKAAFGSTGGGTDPLVIDMDRDGLELTRDGAGAYFDTDTDGFAERTAWTRDGDGFLARDLNGNGLIDNQGELFGSVTVAGFTALAALNSNGDTLINASDSGFASLRVWRDADGDGVTDAGELMTLAAAGIASISLASSAPAIDAITRKSKRRLTQSKTSHNKNLGRHLTGKDAYVRSQQPIAKFALLATSGAH